MRVYVKVIRFKRLYARENTLGLRGFKTSRCEFLLEYVREYQRNMISAVLTDIELNVSTAALISFTAFHGYAGDLTTIRPIHCCYGIRCFDALKLS